ncbi:MAG: hypothetical protein MZV64_42390 [Ignavibacteriales bacterium]|nr:hypothetical protein [Ignavibacteriales bacterium]
MARGAVRGPPCAVVALLWPRMPCVLVADSAGTLEDRLGPRPVRGVRRRLRRRRVVRRPSPPGIEARPALDACPGPPPA